MRQSSNSLEQGVNTESAGIPGTALRVSRVALGTWAMGGSNWGGTDERESVATIWAALDQGINLIDTAPAYGFGMSEEIVGRAIGVGGMRAQAIISTKVGLEWRGGKVYRALGVAGWSLDAATLKEIDRILNEAIGDPIGPEFMAPPLRVARERAEVMA